MKTLIVGIIFIFVTTAGFALATEQPYHKTTLPDPAEFNAHFGDMDANNDEMVDWQEFKAYFPQAEPNVFQATDLNADGSIDHDEWHEFKEAHGLKHKD
jgi:hypothetical protein